MSDILEKILFLQGVDIFSNLTVDELRMIAGITEREDYSDNEYLFRQGDPGNYAYIMVSGKVELFFENAGRELQPFMTVGEGACFGEMALLDGEPRSAGARTLTESVISKISRNDFIQTITRHPAIALGIIAQLSYRLRITNTKTNTLTNFVESFRDLYRESSQILGDDK
ncbi:MAG: cyclic nucleotide-binding domain-containing protein [Spirochaeta sp.]|jgi:CRP/FNR family transcriptional regulator, cyclic AMP receptor protein|nr:cyclic nucleotide-binding domain-containing protein [Spirochaeta sp.]